MEREITKLEFKKLYFRYGQSKDGWTTEYWEHIYESEHDRKYFFREPNGPDENRMFIISGEGIHRMVFLTESTEESFFEFPE